MCPTWRFTRSGAFADKASSTMRDERLILPAADYYVMLDYLSETPLSPIAVIDYFSQRYLLKRRVR